MWKVSNNRNDSALRAFEAEVVLPMWTAIISAHSKGIKVNASVDHKYPALKRALLLRRNGKSLAQVCDDFAQLNGAIIAAEHQLYLDQNNAIRAGILPGQSVALEIATNIFSRYLYEKALCDPKVWEHLPPKSFSRALFIDNFRAENPHVPACPYCDLDTINATANSSIEHFLPRSKFPYLAVNALNMIPSCSACNTSWQGKGTRVIQGTTWPIQTDIGSAILFSFDTAKASISLSAKDSASAIQKYIELIGLRPRYGAKSVYNSILKSGEGLFETFARNNFSEANAVDYVARVRTGAPLTRALTSYVQQLGTYFQDK